MTMATLVGTTPKPAVNYTASPGLWTLGWRRLRSDHLGMVSLAVVVAFGGQMILSGTGLIARDWAKEVGVNYAPPTFVGPAAPAPSAGPAGGETTASGPAAAEPSTSESSVVD